MVQWVGIGTFTAMALGSIPGWGTKILQAAWWRHKQATITKKKFQTQTLPLPPQLTHSNYQHEELK